jgi:hypothetical protein
VRIIHNGSDSYEFFVDHGLDVQPVHAGMSRFAHPTEAWDLYWRQPGQTAWRLVKVGDVIDV